MLINDFYKYKIEDITSEKITATVVVNKHHEIFNGHFPGQPVVPGVCQVLMVKEVFVDFVKKDLQLVSSKSIKFLSVIDPFNIDKLKLFISYKRGINSYEISAEILNDKKSFFKLRGVYEEKK